MELSKENLEEILKIVGQLDEFKVLVSEVVKKLKEFGPDVKDLVSSIVCGLVDLRIEAVKRFEAAGFTREDAIFLTSDEFHGLSQLGKKK